MDLLVGQSMLESLLCRKKGVYGGQTFPSQSLSGLLIFYFYCTIDLIRISLQLSFLFKEGCIKCWSLNALHGRFLTDDQLLSATCFSYLCVMFSHTFKSFEPGVWHRSEMPVSSLCSFGSSALVRQRPILVFGVIRTGPSSKTITKT